MSDTALAIAAGLLGGLNRGMEQRRQRKREEKQDERADKALQIQRDYYLLAKERSDREIAALDREIAAAQKYGYGSVEELETERKYLMAENERIEQDAMLFEKKHRDELLALEKRERETRIAASQESILSSRESRANASEERQYRRRVMEQGESAQDFETIAKQLSDILRTHPVSAEVEGQIRDALASGDPAQAQAALQGFTRKTPGDLFSPLQASHMASEKERREGEESGQRQSAIQHLGAMERMFSSAVDDAIAKEADSEDIEYLRQQLTVIRAALADPQLTDPMAQRILDNIEARNKTSEVPGVEQETKTPGSFFMRPLDEQIGKTALDMRNAPDLAGGLGSAAKLGIALHPIALSLKGGQKTYDFLNDEYKDFMGDPTGYPRMSIDRFERTVLPDNIKGGMDSVRSKYLGINPVQQPQGGLGPVAGAANAAALARPPMPRPAAPPPAWGGPLANPGMDQNPELRRILEILRGYQIPGAPY